MPVKAPTPRKVHKTESCMQVTGQVLSADEVIRSYAVNAVNAVNAPSSRGPHQGRQAASSVDRRAGPRPGLLGSRCG